MWAQNQIEEDSSMNQNPSMPRRRFKLLPILLFIVFGALYYFSNLQEVPLTGRKQFVDIDQETEIALGLQSYQEVMSQSRVISSGETASLIKEVGSKIAKVSNKNDFDWEFNLIDSPDANAFCLPGGKVAVYTGIIPIVANRDGLAVVMSHEISHALARHGAERMSQGRLVQFGQMALGMSMSDMDPEAQRGIMQAFGLGAQYGVLLPFSRKHESEADHMGLLLLARACFNPAEAPKLWERMQQASSTAKPPQFLSTHPSNETRIRQFNEWMPAAMEEFKKYCNS